MKIKKTNILICVCVILICINNMVLAKSKISNKSYAIKSEIAMPVMEIIKDAPIKSKVDQNSFPMEYNFCINNFKEDLINEVEFEYVIEIEEFMENFPVCYELFDCDNEILEPLNSGKSRTLRLRNRSERN